jgi:outer membrane protein assembly factor BamB
MKNAILIVLVLSLLLLTDNAVAIGYNVPYFGTNQIDGAVIYVYPPFSPSTLTFDMACYGNATSIVDSVAIYSDWGGSWGVVASEYVPASSGSHNFNISGIPTGTWNWNVWCNRTSGMANFSIVANRTFSIIPTVHQLWNYTTGGAVMSPTIYDGIIYFGDSDGYVYAINSDGTLNWTYATSGAIYSQSLEVYNGIVYVGSEDNYFYAINSDGTLNWSYATDGAIDASPTIYNGNIYVANDAASLYSFSLNGTINWVVQPSGIVIRTKPAIYNDLLYIGDDDGNLNAINLVDGSTNWTYAIGGTTKQIRGSPTVSNDIVYFGSDTGYFFALFTNGTLAWTYTAGDDFSMSSPTVSDGIIYFGSSDGNLYALNTDGTLNWSYNISDVIKSKPTITNGKIYFGSYDNNAYALYMNGTFAWTYTTNADVGTDIAVSDGIVYVGSNDYNLYVLSELPPPCVPNSANTTPVTTLESCNTSDEQFNWTVWTEWDANVCGAANITWYSNETLSCDYCTPLLANTTKNTTLEACILTEQLNWSWWVQWDSLGCFAQTGLPSDSFANITWYDNETLSCGGLPITGGIVASNPILFTVIPLVVAFGVITFIFASGLLVNRKQTMREVVTEAIGIVIVILVVVFMLAYYLTI